MLCILETTVEIMSCDTVFKCFNTLFSIVYVDLWGDVQIFSYEIINYTPTEASIYNHRAFSKKKQQNQFDLKKKNNHALLTVLPLWKTFLVTKVIERQHFLRGLGLKLQLSLVFLSSTCFLSLSLFLLVSPGVPVSLTEEDGGH